MKRLIIATSTLLALALVSDPAFAVMKKRTFLPTPCLGDCPWGGSGARGGSSGCVTSTYGDAQQGGVQTVCVGADGSSTWDIQEWSDGSYYQDSGSVTMQGNGKFKAKTSSSDLQY
jgi:hypothetical protein